MPLSPRPPATAAAISKMEAFHHDILAEVVGAVSTQDVVVVGMAWNPHVGKARAQLDAAGIAHTYLEYGNYAGKWKERLAIKMWSGWPTFPQVFVKGQLVGGNSDLKHALEDGSFKALLDAPRP
jgi:monothiol glutaredoxin